MIRRQNTLAYALFLILCCLAIVSANGQAPTFKQIRDASEPSRISDWALSGMVWSDASLTEKLARQAAKEGSQQDTLDEQTLSELREIAEQAKGTVEAMERFGWTQLQRGGPESATRESRTGSKAIPETRLDTETPIGRDDPGIDDEPSQEATRLDIDQYRVDDVVDERPRERRNLADAVEDGVEKAIASSPSRGIDGQNPAHISYRETQTRSGTMPFKPDSIYDADDFDPDADYIVNNPLGRFPDNPDSVNYTEEDDEVDPNNPDPSPDGEDELAASLNAEERKTILPLDDRTRTEGTQMGRTDLRQYNRQQPPAIADARWVQLHLDANQMLFEQTTRDGTSVQDVRDAYQRMKVHARLALRHSSADRLGESLKETR